MKFESDMIRDFMDSGELEESGIEFSKLSLNSDLFSKSFISNEDDVGEFECSVKSNIKKSIEKMNTECDSLAFECIRLSLSTGLEHVLEESLSPFSYLQYKVIATDKPISKERRAVLDYLLCEYLDGKRSWTKEELNKTKEK